MAKFKITATAMMTVVKEIEAPTAEEAESIFYDDTYRDIIADADGTDITDINTDTISVMSMQYKVHVTGIEYDLEEDEAATKPSELTLWVESSKDRDTLDFEIDVFNAIEDATGCPVGDFKYEVLETK